MINLNKALIKLLSDIQESSPNLKNTLDEISPIAFSAHVKGHKKLYFYINNKNSSISFSEIFPSQFNINASMMDIIQTFSSGKLKKNNMNLFYFFESGGIDGYTVYKWTNRSYDCNR